MKIGALVLLLLAIAGVTGVIFFRPPAIFSSTERQISFLVPSALGIIPGQTITAAGAKNIGSIKKIRAEADGVLVTAALLGDFFLSAQSRVVVHSNSQSEIILDSPNHKDQLSTPTIIPAEIRLDPPEEMLEPSPIWATSEDTVTLPLAERAFVLDRLTPRIRIALAEQLGRARRQGQAYMILSPLISILPDGRDRAIVLEYHGTSALSLGLLAEAKASLTEAIRWHEAGQDSAAIERLKFNLAVTLARNNQSDEALILLDDIEKASLEFNLLKAGILEDLDRTSEAVTLLESTSALSPIATLNYGILLRKSGLVEDSIRVLEYLSGSWTGEALVSYHLGRSLELLKKTADARKNYQKAAMLERDASLAAVFRAEAERLNR